MKKIISVAFLISFISMPVFAETWCEWSGTQGVNCKSDNGRYIVLPDGLPVAVDEENFNRHGYYKLTITEPAIGADQVKDAEVWDLVDNQMSKTWTVRDLSSEEVDQRDSGAMPLSEYYLWKTLISTGVITQQQAQNNLPQELIEAYQARDRLENP